MFLNKIFIQLLILFLLSISLSHTVFSQKKCEIVEYNQFLNKKYNLPDSEMQFENWIKTKSLNRNEQKASKHITNGVYIIPIVVHVIHNGEALNSGGNISETHILNQIDSLNKDFRRLNADTTETPSAFASIAADTNIEFVLAKRDPEGLPTTGIIRKQGNQTSYNINEDLALKSQSYWPAEDYLNLWITNLSMGLLGYTQFPTSNIEGLEFNQFISRLTDGVVIDWKFIGVNFNTGSFISYGRTCTHEIGHYLGLRHIWGDGNCSKDDFCTDTPNQNNRTTGCPSAGSQLSCESEDMFQNYMDFTDDVCMNLFTICQSERMQIVLENSPRRKSLLSSKGATNPIFVVNDLGIRDILAPLNGQCNSELTPQIEVRNYGSNNICNFTIDFYMNDNLIETITKNVSLAYLNTNLVIFNTITNISNTTSVFRFEISSTNLSTDGNTENNSKSIVVNFPFQGNIPYMENFENSTLNWSVLNSQNNTSATSLSNAPNAIFENIAFSFNYFGSSIAKFGELDWLISPVFDLSALPTADFTFKYSYAPLTGNITDALTIAVSIDCGITFQEQNFIFQKFSPAFGTALSRNTNFIPEDPLDWREMTISLTDFAGNANVVIAIIGHNGNGNNIYIDDIQLSSNNILAYNLGITEVKSIPLSTCFDDIFPIVKIKNFGFETITDFDLQYTLAGITKTISTNGITLLPGKSKSIMIPIKDIAPNEYQIQFEVINPNGNTDEQSSNNVLTRNFNISISADRIPIKENFQKGIRGSNWDFINANSVHNIAVIASEGNGINNKSLFINNYNIPQSGIKNWLISPELDFTNLTAASMLFKVSYANRIRKNDKLEVKISTNCGLTFDQTIYSKKGASLAVKESSIEWFPKSDADWITEFIDLSEFTIWSNVKVAFIITNQNGNNIFIDDIEFFTTASPKIFNTDKSLLRLYPNPASSSFNVKFDLDVKDDLSVTLIDIAGSIVFRKNIRNILNQQINIDSKYLKNGIYILYVTGKNTNLSEQILIDN